MNRLGQMLKLHRVSRNKTVRQLADDIGLSPSTVSRIEGGQPMDMDSFRALLDWLLVSELQPTTPELPLAPGATGG